MSLGESQAASQGVTSEQAAPAPAPVQEQEVSSSCYKKKSESGTFFGDVKSHIDEFVHASYDEHKTCVRETLSKMFGMSKAVSNGTGTTSSTKDVSDRTEITWRTDEMDNCWGH